MSECKKNSKPDSMLDAMTKCSCPSCRTERKAEEPHTIKIYKAEFTPVWPVGGCLIIAAKNEEQAMEIATETVIHTTIESIKEVNIKKPCVIVYESGDY